MDKRLQTVTFQLDLDVFDQLWKAAKDLRVSTDEMARQAVLTWLSQRAAKESGVPEMDKDREDTVKRLEESERILITEALQKHAGNKSKAAEALGISTRTLYRKLEKYS